MREGLMKLLGNEPKDEGLNPRVTCGFSKDADELDTHAPVDLYKPEDMPKKTLTSRRRSDTVG